MDMKNIVKVFVCVAAFSRFLSNLVQKVVVSQPVGVKEVLAVSQHALGSWEGRGLERGQITLHLLGGVGRAVSCILLKREGQQTNPG